METRWAKGLALGLLVAAGSAGAQGDTQQQGEMDHGAMGHGQMEQPETSASAQATKHVAYVNAELDGAATNALMLFEITKSDETYDRAHGEAFTKNIRDSIAGAQEHIRHLEPLAKSDTEKEQLRLLKERVTKAQAMVTTLQSKLDQRSELHFTAGAMHKQLEGSLDPLMQLAKDWDTGIQAG